MPQKLWVGDYTTGDTFEKFAQKAEGIKRIGVLRADVDNLGQTFCCWICWKICDIVKNSSTFKAVINFL